MIRWGREALQVVYQFLFDFGDQEQLDHLVIEVGERRYLWKCRTDRGEVLEIGSEFEVFGRARHHGRIVAVGKIVIYPAHRLD